MSEKPKILIFVSDNRDLSNDLETANYVSQVAVINYIYAQKHGYDFIYAQPYSDIKNEELVDDPLAPSGRKSCYHSGMQLWRTVQWTKIISIWYLLTNEHYKNYDFIIYVDSDCIFNDQDRSVEDFLRNEPIISGNRDNDMFVIVDKPTSSIKPCTGFLAIKNTRKSQKIIKEWWDTRRIESGIYHDQYEFQCNMAYNSLFKKHVCMLDSMVFVDERDQFLRHVCHHNSEERLSRFKQVLIDRNIDKTQFADIINEKVAQIKINVLDYCSM